MAAYFKIDRTCELIYTPNSRVPNEKIDIHQIISLPIQSIYLSTPMLEPP